MDTSYICQKLQLIRPALSLCILYKCTELHLYTVVHWSAQSDKWGFARTAPHIARAHKHNGWPRGARGGSQ